MAIKQHSYFRHVLKITTEQLREADWKLHIDVHEAKLNGNVISLAESTCIRMIEDIAGVDRWATSAALRELNVELRALRKEQKSKEQIRAIKALYRRQEELQYMPEYLCLVATTKALFKRACKGFSVNGMEYVRLVGTTGGVKNSTVVFIAKRARNGAELADELRRRIDNGRDMTKEFVPAKLEAYRALVCSASSPLSDPRGVLVVDDCVTRFKSSYILLKDGETDEPVMETVVDGDVEVVGSDGYGLMTPALAEQWGYDLRLDYCPAGVCVRNSFCKGMVFTFDFHEFAEDVAGTYEVKDIWGETRDIRDVDLVLTASMLKLWDSYPSWEVYWENCVKNGYCFAATKTTPKELDVERRLNYQFTQAYVLTDEQVWRLVEPTVTELADVMGDDYAKALLFLRGKQLTEETAGMIDTPWVAALSADKRMLNDPYVRNQIKSLVKKKITESKFGKLNVHGNFSVLSGDPYCLCQSMWGIPVRGILKAGELYNKYWAECGARELAAFRAPMSSRHNIARLRVNSGWSASHWYQYMDTVTVLNDWDMTTHTLNGADKDGDLIFLTDNQVLVENIQDVLPVQCEQKKARKCVPAESDFVAANMLGFGDDIGSITNKITAQTEVQSMFKPGTPEFEELQYRITAGQHVQQASIDKMKGIVSKPMAKHWYDEKAAEETGDPVDAAICASKKPYFMIYRYPELRSRYLTFEKAAQRSYKMNFRKPFDRNADGDEAHQRFVEWYNRLCPVQYGKGVVNRICSMCEEYFSNYRDKQSSGSFDASILKVGVDYSRYTRDKIAALYQEYMAEFQQMCVDAAYDEDLPAQKAFLKDEYRARCAEVSPSEIELCDIVIDICYATERSKQFAWDMCGDQMVLNLLRRNDGVINWPRPAARGDIVYGGKRFRLDQYKIEDVSDEGYYFE